MKPFNLERALAGEPVVTRAGVEVTQMHLFDTISTFPLVCVVSGYTEVFLADGRYQFSGAHPNDLFMAD